MNRNVYRLGEDPIVRDYAAKVVSPLKRSGIDTLQFDPESSMRGETISKADAMAIVEGRSELATKDEETFEPQTVVAHLQVTRPDFDFESHVWRFRYGGKTISVDLIPTALNH